MNHDYIPKSYGKGDARRAAWNKPVAEVTGCQLLHALMQAQPSTETVGKRGF